MKGVVLPNQISKQTKCTSIPRIYSITIPIDWANLAIGQHHTIRASIDSNGIQRDAYKDFDVTGSWISPEPTHQVKKVIVRQGDVHEITNTSYSNSTGLIQQTPIIQRTQQVNTTSNEIEEIIIIGNTTIVKTNLSSSTIVSPPPANTPTPTPVPQEKPGDNNWILWIFAVLALLCLVGYWLWNG